MPAAADLGTRAGAFASTRWTLVRNAADSQAAFASATEALEELCRIYWPAIYGFLRRHGYERADAQDLTQSFFAHLLENGTLLRASRERGRFRNFLVGALKHCLADEYHRGQAQKRGGGLQFVSLQDFEAEELHHQQMARELTPDELLDARWARLLLDRALATLRAQFATKGEAEMLEVLTPFLGGGKSGIPYETVAEKLGRTLAGTKTLIHRTRSEFAAILRREVMQTVSAPHETDDELRRLRRVFARGSERQAA